MKRSEIKDLYNQSDSALKLLKAIALLLPYCNGEQATAEATQKAAAQAAALWNPVKVMCDYMIDDGSIDMTERLQNIKAEVSQIELSVAKMGYSKEQMPLLLNCRAIINQIKDMEAWTANNPQPQQKHIEAPQQPNEGSGGELAGNGNENAPEGSNEESEHIKLPLELQTKDKRAEKIFTEAYKGGWITERNDGGYQWKGFGNTNIRGNFIAREMKCAYLCAQTYGYYKVGYYHNSDGDSPPWNELEKFFGIKNLSGYIGDVEAVQNPQSWRKAIDNLISSATK